MEHGKSLGDVLRPEWVRNRKESTAEEHPSNDRKEQEISREVGERYVLIVDEVVPGSAMELAGVQAGDQIFAIGEKAIRNKFLASSVQEWAGEPKVFNIFRDEEYVDVTVQPVWNAQTNLWSLGARFTAAIVTVESEKEIEQTEVQRVAIEAYGARGYADLGPSEEVQGESGKYRKEIRAFVLFGLDKEGNPTELDLLKRFNPTNVKVYEQKSIESAGLCTRTDIQVKSVTSKNAPHIILHELRHANQYETGMFGDIESRYRSTSDESYQQNDTWKLTNGNFLTFLKILEHFFSDEQIDDILKNYQKKSRRVMKISNMLSDPNHRGSSDDKVLEEELVKAKAEFDRVSAPDAEMIPGVTIRDVFRLPTLLMERDAEYGALVAIRAIKREIGTDLFEDDATKKMLKFFDKEGKSGSKEGVITMQKLRGKIQTLANIEHYMQMIGVPENCLRDIRSAAKQTIKA